MPPLERANGLLPDRLYSVRLDPAGYPVGLVNLVAHVGLITPDLLAALIAGVHPQELRAGDIGRVQEKCRDLAADCWLTRRREHVSWKSLRTRERHLYQITDEGCSVVAQLHAAERRPGPVTVSVLGALVDATMPGSDIWLEEDELWSRALPHWQHRSKVRQRLRKLESRDLVTHRETSRNGEVEVFSLSREGEKRLKGWFHQRGLPAPRFTRPPGIRFFAHHLLTVQGAALLRRATGFKFIRLLGDEDLRSDLRTGRTMTTGTSDPLLPDGRLRLGRRQGDRSEILEWDIETLTGGYTDEKIREKLQALDPDTTLFVGPTTSVCDRAERLTGHRPAPLSRLDLGVPPEPRRTFRVASRSPLLG